MGDGKHQLIINNCHIDDAGEYECKSKGLTSSGRLSVGEGMIQKSNLTQVYLTDNSVVYITS